MPFSISYDPNDGIVCVQISGDATHEAYCGFRDEALRMYREKSCSCLLVDLRNLVTSKSSILTCFDFGQSFAHVLPHLRIAHVLPEDEKSRNDVVFTSTVGANRGLISKEFMTVEEAKQWQME
ncbi:MAG TPA: hypothetical protein VLX68_07510 [Chitinivibrionales bacterium]|nr:hypothetical protein [Chitinivibrionales bacterium]